MYQQSYKNRVIIYCYIKKIVNKLNFTYGQKRRCFYDDINTNDLVYLMMYINQYLT